MSHNDPLVRLFLPVEKYKCVLGVYPLWKVVTIFLLLCRGFIYGRNAAHKNVHLNAHFLS